MNDQYYDRLTPGQTVTVQLSGDDPDIVGTFREYLNGGGTLAITTPAEENNPENYTVHHVHDFVALYEGLPTTSTLNVEDVINQTVRVTYHCCPPEAIQPPETSGSLLFTFSGNPKADKGEFLYYGQVQMDGNTGFVVPYNGTITRITTNQDGSNDSNVQIRVNNSTVTTLEVTDRDHIFDVGFEVLEGERLSAFNGNQEDLEDFTLSVLMEYPIGPETPDVVDDVTVEGVVVALDRRGGWLTLLVDGADLVVVPPYSYSYFEIL